MLKGDAADAVATLKESEGPDLVILGSGDLITSLAERRLVDTYTLLIHPLVLGTGRRLFPDGAALAQFTLTDSVPHDNRRHHRDVSVELNTVELSTSGNSPKCRICQR